VLRAASGRGGIADVVTLSVHSLLAPDRAVLVTHECQKGVIGAGAVQGALAEAAQAAVIPNIARLVRAARTVGVPVVHCRAVRRSDGAGANHNARIFAMANRGELRLEPGRPEAELLDELGPEPSDVVLDRLHGLGPMDGTDLDPVLRNLGVSTIVGVGASVNIGILSLAMNAVSLGYQVVVPTDAVVGVPQEYVEQVVRYTLALITTVTTTEEVLGAWSPVSQHAAP
jgi:nicotinamidase-related amidase